MSTLEFISLGVLERPPANAGELTLAAWLADGRAVPPKVALQLITRIGNALCDAHQQGHRHGSLTSADVVLSCCSASSLGVPTLRGFAPSAGAWPRREDVAADVAGLAGIARELLLPAPPEPNRRRQGRRAARPALGRRTPSIAAVIGAGMDRREGVFVFDTPLDFVVALEAAAASDAGAAHKPDPALAALHQRRRRRRVIKVLAGAAAACLALLVVSNATAAPGPSAARAPSPISAQR